jgi:glycosyltransferase involved in cell wall biosynthesis
VGIVPHGLDTGLFTFRERPDDYLVFLGRFTEGKGVLQAIDIARRVKMRLILAAAENEYYRDAVAPHVDGEQVVFAGELDHAAKVALLGGARALLYPVQSPESFGLVLAEAMACGTPVAALDCGPVAEIVEPGVSGGVFPTIDALVDGLPGVLRLDRAGVRSHAMARFGADQMVEGYEAVYVRLAEAGPVRQA